MYKSTPGEDKLFLRCVLDGSFPICQLEMFWYLRDASQSGTRSAKSLGIVTK